MLDLRLASAGASANLLDLPNEIKLQIFEQIYSPTAYHITASSPNLSAPGAPRLTGHRCENGSRVCGLSSRSSPCYKRSLNYKAAQCSHNTSKVGLKEVYKSSISQTYARCTAKLRNSPEPQVAPILALLLTSGEWHKQVRSVVYSSTTFSFQDSAALKTFLDRIHPHALQSIRKVHLSPSMFQNELPQEDQNPDTDFYQTGLDSVMEKLPKSIGLFISGTFSQARGMIFTDQDGNGGFVAALSYPILHMSRFVSTIKPETVVVDIDEVVVDIGRKFSKYLERLLNGLEPPFVLKVHSFGDGHLHEFPKGYRFTESEIKDIEKEFNGCCVQ